MKGLSWHTFSNVFVPLFIDRIKDLDSLEFGNIVKIAKTHGFFILWRLWARPIEEVVVYIKETSGFKKVKEFMKHADVAHSVKASALKRLIEARYFDSKKFQREELRRMQQDLDTVREWLKVDYETLMIGDLLKKLKKKVLGDKKKKSKVITKEDKTYIYIEEKCGDSLIILKKEHKQTKKIEVIRVVDAPILDIELIQALSKMNKIYAILANIKNKFFAKKPIQYIINIVYPVLYNKSISIEKIKKILNSPEVSIVDIMQAKKIYQAA